MFKAIVFDRDGSLYSISEYITPFAEHLSRHFDQKIFMSTYNEFRKNAKIGDKYSLITLNRYNRGKRLKSAFWIVAAVAFHHGYKGDFNADANDYFRKLADEQGFLGEPELVNILKDFGYRTALVTNACENKMLDRLGVDNLFELKYMDSDKTANLEKLASDIEGRFKIRPSETLWVEDDLEVLAKLKKFGYYTVLRKTQGFNYVPDKRLQRFANLIIEDRLSELYEILKSY